MQVKKVLAVVMSLCMAAGAVSYGAPVITQTITAQAAETETSWYTFNENRGELTLHGTIDGEALRNFTKNKYVVSIIAKGGTVFPEDCSNLFSNFEYCTSIDISYVNTSKVTNMSGMFSGCKFLKKLDVSGIDTGCVTNMSSTFYDCSYLTKLDVSGFDTRRVTDMSNMFDNCYGLQTLDVSGLDTSNVTNMSGMFKYCYGLPSLDISGFDTGNVTDMSEMFYLCYSLETLDVSGFDTSNVTNMSGMFECCYGLPSLDVSGFDTSNITDFSDMFADCDKLRFLSLGENFKAIPEEAALVNKEGWVTENDPETVVSGDGEYAVIKNNGKNIYIRFGYDTKLTYPTNIKVEYSAKYHQVRFKWDKVEGADRYGIAVYLAGKWRVQNQNITDTVYTSPKNLTPGRTYKVAIAARVDGKWDTANAIKNAVTVTIK